MVRPTAGWILLLLLVATRSSGAASVTTQSDAERGDGLKPGCIANELHKALRPNQNSSQKRRITVQTETTVKKRIVVVDDSVPDEILSRPRINVRSEYDPMDDDILSKIPIHVYSEYDSVDRDASEDDEWLSNQIHGSERNEDLELRWREQLRWEAENYDRSRKERESVEIYRYLLQEERKNQQLKLTLMGGIVVGIIVVLLTRQPIPKLRWTGSVVAALLRQIIGSAGTLFGLVIWIMRKMVQFLYWLVCKVSRWIHWTLSTLVFYRRAFLLAVGFGIAICRSTSSR